MSLGGWLVVMDRAGRDVKRYRLRSGSVTLGSDRACDIRVMLPSVSPHHATVSALYRQSVVRSVSERETLVNGAPVSVAALRHGDVVSLGGRSLRWEYPQPGARPLAPEPALLRRVQRTRTPRRGSEPPPRNVIVPEHRASMPASTSGKQVAIVQPQRRDTSDLSDAASPRLPPNKRPRLARSGPPAPDLSDTTKATLWIESRKTSPRKSVAKALTPVKTPAKRKNIRKAFSAKKTTPLRMVVLKKAQSAQKIKVTKIQAPLKMDSTKQAAIMLMTRHTPKSKQTSPNRGNRGPSFVVKKTSPVRDAALKRRADKRGSSGSPDGRAAQRDSDSACRSIIELTDSEIQSSERESSFTRRSGKSSLRSPHLSSPKKSALKDPNVKSSTRKTESIKFDLSNLDNVSSNRSSDIILVDDTGNSSYTDDSEDDYTLRYSDTSKSPSPRKSINSRSTRMLQNTLGTTVTLSPKSDRRMLTAESPQTRKSLRSSIILQEALRINKTDSTEVSTYSRRITNSLSDQSWSTTIASTRTVSPRASRGNVESYSYVNLVSIDSNDSTTSKSGSVYNSADSNHSETYDSPGLQSLTSASRRAVGCSTPYDRKNRTDTWKPKTRNSNRSAEKNITNTLITTPENSEDTTRNITINSIKISRSSKKRISIVTRQKKVMDEEGSESDSSPKSSKRVSKRSVASPLIPKNISINETFTSSPSVDEGTHTPENQRSPIEASTPVLNIQSLLDASQNRNRTPPAERRISKRKTIAVLRSEPRTRRIGMKSKSLNFRRSGKSREISTTFAGSDDSALNCEEKVITPRSGATPLPEGVKNKHSTAKKPQSKRSLIDDLNESDIVKQLFNSPVKRKLSQSMTEFSRRHLFDDDDERPRRPTRATAGAGRSLDRSISDHTQSFTPEIFVSPLNTPRSSPNMTGIKRLFQKDTPENDLRDVRGVRGLLRTPRNRKSIASDVSGVKTVFAKSPRNRLSDVRIKGIFAASPKNDLRRVSGVKGLFQSQRKKGRSPKNELDDLRGVRALFKEDFPRNDFRNVSGVKRTLQRNSPRNDLTDVRGVKRMFAIEKQRDELSDVSGVERLFHDSTNYDSTFDQLLGRPPIRAVYSKSKSFTTTSKVQKRGKNKKSKSLHDVNLGTNNVEEWLQQELAERLHKNAPADTSNERERKSKNVSKTMRELIKLNTDTVEGSVPVITTRTRNSSVVTSVQSEESLQKKSASELYGAHTLPIKKRSLIEAATSRSNNDRSHKLPIKKRAVIHSTPVKGRVNITMNASEIGRMSPISAEDKTAQIYNTIRSPQREGPSKNQSSLEKIITIAKTSLKNVSVGIIKLSPKKTRSAQAAESSPPMRTRRSGKPKAQNREVPNLKKRRSSIVITKKPPAVTPKSLSPRATRRGKIKPLASGLDSVKISPKKTRSARGQKSQVIADNTTTISRSIKTAPSKKSSGTKVTRTDVIVETSQKLNPRTTRNTKAQTASSETEARRSAAGRPRGERGARAAAPALLAGQPAVVVDESLTVVRTRRTRMELVEISQTLRTRKVHVENSQTEKSNVQSNKTRKVADTKKKKVVESVALKIEPPATAGPVARRGQRKKADEDPPESRRGGARKTAASRPPRDAEAAEPRPTRGRKVKREISPKDNPNTAISVQPLGRGRKRKNMERDEPVAEDEAGGKETRRTRKTTRTQKEDEPRETRRPNSTRRGAGDSSSGPLARTAGDVKPAKGKKGAPAAESAAPAGGRRKRADVEVSDAKEHKKEPAKRPRAAPPAPRTPPAPRARRLRGDVSAAVGGRARRR